MFDDRLEFMSLGGIMPGVTYDLMLMGVSVPRNEKLAQIFYRLKIIEAFGTGIPRIFSAYEQSPVKPEIPVINGGFLIRLPNQNFGLQKAKANANKREQKLLEAFREAEFTKEDAAETLGISAGGAYKLLVRMSKKGLLTIKKDGKQLIYSMIKQ
jgi:ATP-dependent DNA helicase RecG